MKLINIYCTVVTILLIGGVLCGVYMWRTLSALETAITTVDEEVGTSEKSDMRASTTPPFVHEDIVIQIHTLSPSQQAILRTLGYDGATFTLTAEMALCAEQAVGEVRVIEIMAGASPSSGEAVKLLPCLQK